jgi:hypothetical protein
MSTSAHARTHKPLTFVDRVHDAAADFISSITIRGSQVSVMNKGSPPLIGCDLFRCGVYLVGFPCGL